MYFVFFGEDDGFGVGHLGVGQLGVCLRFLMCIFRVSFFRGLKWNFINELF